MRDRYVIENGLGEGGMGRVFAAFDRILERRVALKVLRTDGDVSRLLREARAVAAFAHPNIVTIHDVLESAEPPCLVMELVEGRTLRAVIEAGDATLVQRVSYLRAIATALAAAHRAGFVHRDLKPENVMIQVDDTVKLLDFGLAQQRADGDHASKVAGTPGYMAPEQLAGWTVSAPADQYAWGVIAVELLAGERIDGATPSRAREQLRGRIPPAVAEVIARTLALAPADRFGAMADVADAIVGDRELVRAREPTTVDALPRRRRRRWVIAPFVGAAAGALWLTGDVAPASRTAAAHELSPYTLDVGPAITTPSALRTAAGLQVGVLGLTDHRVTLAAIEGDRVTARVPDLLRVGQPVAISLVPSPRQPRYFVASERAGGAMVLVGRDLADDEPSAVVALDHVRERFRVVDLAPIADPDGIAHTVFALTDDDTAYTLRVFGGGQVGASIATLPKIGTTHPRVVACADDRIVDVATEYRGALVVRRFTAGASPRVLELATDAAAPTLERDGDRLSVLWIDRGGGMLRRVAIDGAGRIVRVEAAATAVARTSPQQLGRVLAWSHLDQVFAGCGDSLAAAVATRTRIAGGPLVAGPWLARLPGGDHLVAWLGRNAGELVVHRAIVRCPQ